MKENGYVLTQIYYDLIQVHVHVYVHWIPRAEIYMYMYHVYLYSCTFEMLEMFADTKLKTKVSHFHKIFFVASNFRIKKIIYLHVYHSKTPILMYY